MNLSSITPPPSTAPRNCEPGSATSMASNALPSAMEHQPTKLSGLRAMAFDAVHREQISGLEKILDQYRSVLESTARNYVGNPEQLAQIEREHARFQEYLRTRLLALRFSIQKDLERLHISKRYGGSERSSEGLNIEA
jgi:hypothetical protein